MTVSEYYTTSHNLGFILCDEIHRLVNLSGAKYLREVDGK
jgi:peptidyl-tRNA hydrolase